MLSWKGWLNRTVPDADAVGADAAMPTVTVPITSITDVARDIIRRASREKTIPRLLFRVASLAGWTERPYPDADVVVRPWHN